MIISASGMCESGRILHHLMNNVGDERNTILLVGYMAEYTLGRRIKNREKQIKIFGDMYDLKAHVEEINGLSGHADYQEMLAYLKSKDIERYRALIEKLGLRRIPALERDVKHARGQGRVHESRERAAHAAAFAFPYGEAGA